jgi:hypothetical protein
MRESGAHRWGRGAGNYPRQSAARFVLMRREQIHCKERDMIFRAEIANAVLLSFLVAEIALAAFWLANG